MNNLNGFYQKYTMQVTYKCNR